MSERIATRKAYGKALAEFGGNQRIVVLDADLKLCTMSVDFAEKYPERFVDLGIAEANMATAAAGIATTGKIVFIHSFAVFSAGRCYDQIRNSIAYPNLNVKIIGSHAGLTVGPDGATHQCIEDLSLMRTIPGMTVLSPCDANETRAAVKAMIDYDGPCYMRTSRYASENVTQDYPEYNLELGKGVKLCEGDDVTIIATGLMVQEAIKAAELLKAEGINARLIDMHTIKPLDKALLLDSAKKTGAVVTCEEHNVIGGLGGAVSEYLSETYPAPVMKVGVNDTFGRSGEAGELLELYGLTAQNIAVKAKAAIAMKNTRVCF